MFRVIGFLGGIILFLVLGVLQVNGYAYFLICAILNISTIFFVILFRVFAKYLNGFWKIWCKRLQRWISGALLCLGQYTQMPEYEVHLIKGQNGQKTIATQKRTRTNFLWGLVEMVICIGFTGVAPAILLFVFFIYGEAIYSQCKFKSELRQIQVKREEIIARQSSRMSMGIVPLDEEERRSRRSSTSSLQSVSLVYPLMEPVIAQKSSQSTFEVNKSQQNPYTIKYRLSPSTQLKPYHIYQKMRDTENTPPKQDKTITVKGISHKIESQKQEQIWGSLPKYRGHQMERKETYGLQQDINNEEL